MVKKGIAVYKSGSATDVTFQFLEDGSSSPGKGLDTPLLSTK